MATKGFRGKVKRNEGLVLLKNLVPRKNPNGGTQKAVFGQGAASPDLPGVGSTARKSRSRKR